MCAPPRFVVILGRASFLARPLLPAPCQSVRKENLIFFAITLDLTAQDAILYSMKIKVRKLHGIFSKARPHKRVNKVLPRKEKHKKSVDLS